MEKSQNTNKATGSKNSKERSVSTNTQGFRTMTQSLRNRIIKYALKNRHRLVWKHGLHGLLYSADLRALSKIKEIEVSNTQEWESVI